MIKRASNFAKTAVEHVGTPRRTFFIRLGEGLAAAIGGAALIQGLAGVLNRNSLEVAFYNTGACIYDEGNGQLGCVVTTEFECNTIPNSHWYRDGVCPLTRRRS